METPSQGLHRPCVLEGWEGGAFCVVCSHFSLLLLGCGGGGEAEGLKEGGGTACSLKTTGGGQGVLESSFRG